jgi:hypothetical protein
MVQGIGNTGSGIDNLLQSATQTARQKKTAGNKADDTVTLGKETDAAVTYNRTAGIDAPYDAGGVVDLKDLIYRLLSRQGITLEAAMAGESVEIDEETRAEARSLVAEDGYWGVEQTSERIFQMAVANAGDDTDKLDQIKSAIDKGFEMAKNTLGGSLPEISLNTYDAVMEKLDAWADGKTA